MQIILARLLEILGEVTGAVTPEFRAKYPEIPWASMKTMRNWLAHAYFDINLDTIWNVVEKEIGSLAIQLEAVLTAEGIDCAEPY